MTGFRLVQYSGNQDGERLMQYRSQRSGLGIRWQMTGYRLLYLFSSPTREIRFRTGPRTSRWINLITVYHVNWRNGLLSKLARTWVGVELDFLLLARFCSSRDWLVPWRQLARSASTWYTMLWPRFNSACCNIVQYYNYTVRRSKTWRQDFGLRTRRVRHSAS